jgi:hypothetical protein
VCAAIALIALVLVVPGATFAATGTPRLIEKSAAPLCKPSAVQVTATTSAPTYSLGHHVVLISSISNASKKRCSVWLGKDPGFSPSFTVVSSKGRVVWNRCWTDDQPGACFEILHARTLDPGATYSQKASWDQRSAPDGDTPVPVPRGTYDFSTDFQYIGEADVPFVLVRATS